MEENFDTIVIGGGASGIAAAISSAEHGMNTLLLEKSGRLGRKISASGNGRCNIMNTGLPRYYGEDGFAKEVMKRCGPKELSAFFRKYGLLLTEEREGRVYPVTMQSVSVIRALQNALKMNHVNVFLNTGNTVVRKKGNQFVCATEGNEYKSDKLIVCTGGAANKKLGGCSDGYRYLQSFGHHLEEVFPSLVPVKTDGKSISGLAGIRIKCCVSLMDGTDVIHSEEGEVLFTDYGLSGICVMQCSRFIRKQGLHFELDLLSGIFSSYEDAMREIRERRDRFADLSPVLLLEGILLPKLSFAVLKQAGIPLRGETASSLRDQDLENIIKTAGHYRTDIADTQPLEDAQVTAGGIKCSEFDPSTMESGIISGLFAAGEVLNVDGDCGGFNLMFAFASGLIAGGFRGKDSSEPGGAK